MGNSSLRRRRRLSVLTPKDDLNGSMAQHQKTAASHLPVLYNPLLNCIFNNPNHNKSPFKNVVEELRSKHNQYTIIVPPAHVLNEFHDPATDGSSNKVVLKSLCYTSEDFIKSHVIKTGSPVSSTITPISKEQSVIYNTLNNKQVLIKNRMIYTGKGFKRSLKLRIASISYFKSFCEYFPRGSQFMIIFIESSLIGGSPPLMQPQLPPVVASNGSATTLSSASTDVESITFEKLLRSFPLLSKAVSEKFYRLFHHNNNQFYTIRMQSRKKLRHIKVEFDKILEEAFKIISDSVKTENPNSEQTYNLLNHIISIYPGIDLDRLVHEYVELNLYDVFWSQLIYQYNWSNEDKESYDPEAVKNLTAAEYEKMSCLSLNQLDIPTNKPWQINELHERINLAVQEFKKLGGSSSLNSTAKTNIVLKTVDILTAPSYKSNLMVDADTLMALLIMTVVHAKVDNLEAHMYYMKNFNAADTSNDGQFHYIMSNLDAVICHLSDKDTGFAQLVESSQQNYELWSAIFDKDLEKVKSIVEAVQSEYMGKEIPANHFLRSRNITGEGILSFAIKVKDFDIYDLLMNSDPNWLSIEDILFDMNVMTSQNLLMCALLEETSDEIIDDLITTIIECASVQEKVAYYNMQDKNGRCAGHYLFHKYELIPRIGHLVNWEMKDHNSHTPLFSLCRCYDHADYMGLVTTAFDVVYKKYDKGIDFDKHVDKAGNTLLHILLKGIPETKILSNPKNLINVNQFNSRNLTPLMQYVKYGRFANLQNILQQDKLEFMLEDDKNFYNVFDYLSFSATKSASTEKFKRMYDALVAHYFDTYFPQDSEQKLAALNGKYHANARDWLIYQRDGHGRFKAKSLSAFKQLMYLEKLKQPLTTFPDSDIFWRNYALNFSTTPIFHKARVNNFIKRLNIMYQSMVYQENIDTNKFFEAFVNDVEEISVLDSKKSILATYEQEKAGLGEIKLKVGHIQEIEFFLNFSTDEVKKSAHLINKITKLVLVGEQKQLDLKNVEDLALNGVNEQAFFKKSFDIAEFAPQRASLDTLGGYMSWIAQVENELLKNIYKISTDVAHWKDLYHNICKINSELKSMEPPVAEASTDGSANGAPLVPPYPQPTSPNENALTKVATNGSAYSASDNDNIPDIKDEGEGLFGFGTGKKSKYKKLVVSKADLVKKIMNLNAELKLSHEIIATEISKFMKFRGQFLVFALKQFVKEDLRSMRNRQLELEKALYRIKNH
ncbi:uncharacterized protein LODBEIA_P44000 [Lodderomyces beijingensis]|uniref:VPS9 domain-containing protein n=1 Tax=Lodderomyces beijingensis TaxID=1775926 RepID=A0ABP0ZSU9_9ASCO